MAPTVALIPLNLFNVSAFEPLTASAYRPLLLSGGAGSRVLATGALLDHQPVGLAVGRLFAGGRARVLSVYVLPPYRKQGIGRQIIRQLERQLAHAGATCAELEYAIGTTVQDAVERLLKSCDWPTVGPRLHVFEMDGQIMSAPWFDAAVLPAGYRITEWHAVPEEERRRLDNEAWVPAVLRPSRFVRDLEPIASLAVWQQGDVIGWSLARRLDSTTIRYANLFVRPSSNRVGRTYAALALLAEAVRRQAGALGRSSRGRFEVAPENASFLRFINRHFAPYLLTNVLLQRVTKPL